MSITMEKEITVRLKWELDEAKVHFVNAGVPLTESFVVKDIYMVENNIDIVNFPVLDVIDKTVVLREFVRGNGEYQLVYKNKKYDNKGKVIHNQKYVCELFNIDDAFNLLKAIGFKECFRYEQECLEYNVRGKKILLQYISDLGLFAEIEDNNKSIDELINDLNEMGIPYYEGNYFVKKAELMLNKVKKQRR